MQELKTGITREVKKVVTQADTAKALGSGLAQVLSTPMLAAWMENAALLAVQPVLEEGRSTVGTLLELKHLAASPVGMEVRVVATLTEIDRRCLTFEIEAFDKKEKVAEARHQRFIIDAQAFQAKADAKLG